jgi:hypothetical protein
MKDTTNLTKEVQYLPFIEKEKKRRQKKKGGNAMGSTPKRAIPKVRSPIKPILGGSGPIKLGGK